jgi:hypothetical protein
MPKIGKLGAMLAVTSNWSTLQINNAVNN